MPHGDDKGLTVPSTGRQLSLSARPGPAVPELHERREEHAEDGREAGDRWHERGLSQQHGGPCQGTEGAQCARSTPPQTPVGLRVCPRACPHGPGSSHAARLGMPLLGPLFCLSDRLSGLEPEDRALTAHTHKREGQRPTCSTGSGSALRNQSKNKAGERRLVCQEQSSCSRTEVKDERMARGEPNPAGTSGVDGQRRCNEHPLLGVGRRVADDDRVDALLLDPDAPEAHRGT